MKKLITVITATYNAGATLERCIRSVISQKADDIEFIIADGASKDNTMDIVSKYSDSIDIAFSEPDKGVYDAWNKAIAKSHGEWIMFLGADDYYADYTFDHYRQFIAAHDVSNIDLISAKGMMIDADGNMKREVGRAYKYEEFCYNSYVTHGSALHNRKLFDEVGLYSLDYSISADYELLLRKKLNALFLDEIILYMQNDGLSNSTECLKQIYRIKRQHHSCSLPVCLFHFVKGFMGFHLRRLYWSLH